MWDVQLPKVACCIRTVQHEVLGTSPYYANFGRQMATRGDRDYRRQGLSVRDTPETDARAEAMVTLREDNRIKLTEANDRMNRQYNSRRRKVGFMANELVWRRNFALSDAANFYAGKLAPKFLGPFIVKRKVSPWTYELVDSAGKNKRVRHVKDLKPHNRGESR